MIRLRTFGAVDLLDDDDRSLEQVLVQPKRLALLVYLAIATPRGVHRRDRLLSLFWPELDTARARDALNQALRFLRQALGPDAFVRRGTDEVGVNDVRVECDAVAFREAIASGRPQDALSLYRGEFLNAFFVEDCRGFEEWAERERTTLRIEAARGAHRLAERDESAGMVPSAIAWAERALVLVPDDEPGMRHVLRLYQRVGDRSGALRTYDSFARRIRAEYGCEPSPETTSLVRELREGERASAVPPQAPVIESVAPSARAGLPEAVVEEPRRAENAALGVRGGAFARGMRAAASVAFVVLMAVGTWRVLGGPSPTLAHGSVDVDAIAILPFRISGADRSLSYLHDGMAELLAAEFTGEGGPRAIDPSSVLRAFSRAGGDDGQLSSESALRLARDLGAEQVLVGAVVGTSRQLTFTASVLAVPSGAVRVPAVTVVGPEDSLASMLGSLSGRLLSRATGAWRLSARDPGTTSAEAVRAFLAGREAYRIARGPDAGATELSRALRIDSSFVLAAYWLTVSAALFNPVPDIDAIRRVAWRDRARLGAEQRRLLEAIIGPAGPDVADNRARELAAIERIVATAPQSFDAWLLLGDTYFHLGALLGYSDWRARSKQAFGRALALDTTVNVVGHLAMLAFLERDMASHARWLALLDRMAPTGQTVTLARYLDAVVVGNPGEVQAARERFARDADYSGYAWAGGVELPAREAESLLGALQRSATTVTRQAQMPRLVKMIAANGGQPVRAAEARRRFFGDDSLERDLDILMWGEGDSAAAERLARALPAAGDHRDAWRFPCEIALSRLRRADTTGVGTMMAALIGTSVPDAQLCGRLVGLLGTDVKSGAGLASVFRADSLMKAVPDGMAPTWTYDVAVALARRGQWGAAAAAARRRLFSRPARLALSLRDEGRWAALAGDTVGAVAAFRHYLVLREHPEPELAPEGDSVRAELSRLLVSRPR